MDAIAQDHHRAGRFNAMIMAMPMMLMLMVLTFIVTVCFAFPVMAVAPDK